MKIAILGFAREGTSLLKFLRSRGSARINSRINADKDEIWILDANSKIKLPRGVKSQLGKNYLKNLAQFDLVFRTPGTPYNLPELVRARKNGVEFSSLTKLFFELCPTKNIIGVTGTKGKGTTSTLIYQILKTARKDVYLAGNIGKPALEILPKLNQNSWVVLELSSFQLIDLQASPHIAVALMVTSEHLDWHKNVQEYVAAKANIVRFQSKNDFAVLNQDYPQSRGYRARTRAQVLGFSRHKEIERGTFVRNGYFWFAGQGAIERMCATNILQIPGEHNHENVAAAITVAKLLKISNKTIDGAIASFRGLEHRLEFVREVNGVKYYDDSYASSPEPAEVAIQAFSQPKVLILGGSYKGGDFKALGHEISRSQSIRAIIGIGQEWSRIKKCIHNPKIKIIEHSKNMREIVRAVQSVAKPGDVVLLSPACASFDMFKNYTERGEQFKKLVRRLTK